MQCDFWKRKLVTSISANLTRRPWPLFCRRPFSASAMFPFIIFCLSGPCQQVTSFSPWLFHEFEYSNFNAENFVTEVQEALDNLPINPYETLDSGILMLEQCLNEQAPKKKLSKQKLSHKPWITPCLLKSIKTKNRLYRALVLVKRPMQSIKSTGIKLFIYWKSTKKLLSVTIFVLSKWFWENVEAH